VDVRCKDGVVAKRQLDVVYDGRHENHNAAADYADPCPVRDKIEQQRHQQYRQQVEEDYQRV
jgi:hypothetical protein